MMIVGEGHGGTESNNKLFNSLVKSVSVVVVPECSISAKCSKCRVQWRMAVVTVSPLVHCSGLRRVDTEDTATTAAVAPPDSIEHGIGFLGIKIPSAIRRFLESNNGARKSHADLGHIS